MSRWTSQDRLLVVEERRFVVLLGILAILIGYRDSFPKDFPFPLPYPFPHLQIFTLPAFNSFLGAFGLYSVFLLAYFSEDHLSEWLRVRLRRLGWAVLIGYWAYFFYFSSGLLVSLYVHDNLLVLFLLAFEQGFLILAVGLFEYVWGGNRWMRRAVRFYFTSYFTMIWMWHTEALNTRLGQTRFVLRLRRLLSPRLPLFLRAFRTHVARI